MPATKVASNAKNAAAGANSSGWPKRPIGLLAVNSAFSCAARSGTSFSSLPVSIEPGLIALTRSPLGSSSRLSVRAHRAQGRLGGRVDTERVPARLVRGRRGEHHGAALGEQRRQLLHG